jgi:hypothetical protein
MRTKFEPNYQMGKDVCISSGRWENNIKYMINKRDVKGSVDWFQPAQY